MMLPAGLGTLHAAAWKQCWKGQGPLIPLHKGGCSFQVDIFPPVIASKLIQTLMKGFVCTSSQIPTALPRAHISVLTTQEGLWMWPRWWMQSMAFRVSGRVKSKALQQCGKLLCQQLLNSFSGFDLDWKDMKKTLQVKKLLQISKQCSCWAELFFRGEVFV